MATELDAPPASAAVLKTLQEQFAELIATRTQNFTGREWVFDAIDAWLARADRPRFFLLSGGPGTGKSAIAARLAQMSAGSVRRNPPRRIAPGFLAYAHFCRSGGYDTTLSTKDFVRALGESLGNAHPEFRDALVNTRSQNFKVDVSTGDVAPGGIVTGAKLTLQIFGGTGRPLFNDLVRGPLLALCAARPDLDLVILVDSLDEAFSIDPDNNIAKLVAAQRDLPPQVRFIVTARSKNPEITDLLGEPALDLIADAPPGLDEVQTYASGRLAPFPEPQRTQAAAEVANASKGNFLYAYHVVNSLLQRGPGATGVGGFELPQSLEGVYSDFLKRQLAANTSRWNDVYRPLLGLIAVARGDGLTRNQLIGITDLAEDTANDVLTACAEFLVGGENLSPYRIYHQSFREFLLTDPRYGVTPAERHAAIAHWLENSFGSNWKKCKDPYALRYTPQHWADAATLSTTRREVRTRSLLDLVLNDGYQAAFEKNIGNVHELRASILRAVQVTALNDDDDLLPLMIRAPLGLRAFDRKYLQAEAVAALAEQGKLEEALARLRLFSDIGENWQHHAPLILCWLAFDSNPASAQQVFDRVSTWKGDDISQCVVTRVAHVVKGAPAPVYPPVDPIPPEAGRERVRRMSGQSVDPELMQQSVNPSLMLNATVDPELNSNIRQYAARSDAPLLVSIAVHDPAEGADIVDSYIHAHAGYNYVVYRNSSLCYVLDAVVRLMPDDVWVRRRLRELLIAALTGGAVEFREGLPLTARLVRSSLAPAGAQAEFTSLYQRAAQAASQLQNQRGKDDTWGDHKRRLAALMELASLQLRYPPAADDLRQRIVNLPDGFAGFQAPAFLRFADALRASAPQLVMERRWALERALTAAHHIQDYHFCARVTARCSALRRWHDAPLTSAELVDVIDQLARIPADDRFAADHLVGEQYLQRSPDSDDQQAIEPARAANTLAMLAEVFQRDVGDFRRLSPQFPAEQIIAPGTSIKVPDPGLAPLLAVHLAARVLAEPTLNGQRPTLIRSLVATATANATTLDTVLSYLLIASEVSDAGLADELVEECGEVTFESQPIPLGNFGPDAVIPS